MTPKRRETIRAWLDRNPTNTPARLLEIWPEPTPEAARHVERARRMIVARILVADRTDLPERERRYRVAVQYLPPGPG